MSREAMQLALGALEDANDVARMEFSDEDYYGEAINALRQALETEQEPVISTDHGTWIPSTLPGEEGETYCKRCLLRDKFFGLRQCNPHFVYKDPPQRKPQALAQPEQEPVAWVCYGMSSDEKHCVDYEQSDIDAIPVGAMLYTAPPKKEWVGLTDEEIAQGPQEVLPALYGRWGWAEKEAFEAVVAWAEAKLKDKNHG